jgi:protein-L-isoaspartate(D-aspartate) O-methyltransferase
LTVRGSRLGHVLTSVAAGTLALGQPSEPVHGAEPAERPAQEAAAPDLRSAFGERGAERASMVERQLAARDIRDKTVLWAMGKVPRHAFIPDSGQDEAYGDHPVRIGLRQTISQPYIVAYMTQALKLGPKARVLEIGTGSGYQAAVLGELAKEVYTIEIVEPLAKRARAVCDGLGYKNIHYRIGDGYRGWPEAAPFDAVIVTAAPGHVPQPLVDQLKVGGVMIIPVGVGSQELLVLRKTKTGATRQRVMHVRFVPMTGEAEGAAP